MILVASDKFKGTFTAREINELIAGRVRELYPGEEVVTLPMADGGEGTAEALALRFGLERRVIEGKNPLGQDCKFEYYEGREIVAVDSAAVVGLSTFPGDFTPAPLASTSLYLGKLIDRLLREGNRQIFLGIGGTMTVDGGIGFLSALGFRFLDSSGREMEVLNPQLLSSIAKVTAPERDFSRLTALADVDVPLTAPTDQLSSLSFAAQKGVKPSEIQTLRSGLENFRHASQSLSSTPHFNGAGGGLGYAVSILSGARLLPGAEYLLGDTISRLRPSRIFTGEGRFDEQSFGGKVTGTILAQSAPLGIPVHIICGCTTNPILPSNATLTLLSDFRTTKTPGRMARAL